MRMIIRKERPERNREVAWVILTYTFIFMVLSLFWVDLGLGRSRQEKLLIKDPQKAIDSLLVEIHLTDSRRKVSGLFEAFQHLGEAAIDPIIKMLSNDWEVNREFAAMILGDIFSQRAVPHHILSLDDPDQRLRNQAAWSLGDIGAVEATGPLINKLHQDTLGVSKSDIYRELGKIGGSDSWEILVQALKSQTWYHVTQALASLVFILLQEPDAKAVPYLENMVEDEDFETRFFARQAIRKINQQSGKPH